MTRIDSIISWVIGPRVLDVGCTAHSVEPSSSYWLHGKLRSIYPEITGIDISSENIQKLKGLGYNNLFLQSAENFSFDECFDTIVAGELIEHLSNPGNFFERAYDSLKEGGRLIVTTPYVFSLLYLLYGYIKYPRTCQNREHTIWFCPQTLRELAKRYAFNEVHFELVQSYRDDDPSI